MLKSALDKLALVGIITVDPKLQAQELTQSVGEEIARMITEQKNLEKRFEELVSAQHILRTLPNKSKLKENQVTDGLQDDDGRAVQGPSQRCSCPLGACTLFPPSDLGCASDAHTHFDHRLSSSRWLRASVSLPRTSVGT